MYAGTREEYLKESTTHNARLLRDAFDDYALSLLTGGVRRKEVVEIIGGRMQQGIIETMVGRIGEGKISMTEAEKFSELLGCFS